MAGFFLKPSKGHSRSISLPARSHPITIKIEQELNNLILNLQPCSYNSPIKLCSSIEELSNIYNSLQDILKLPQTHQSLSSSSSSSSSSSPYWVDELLEEPLSFLDICSNTSETISYLRQTMSNLQSSLRRTNLQALTLTLTLTSLKNSKKDIIKSLSSLTDTKLPLSHTHHHDDDHLVAVVRVIRETSLASSLVFRNLLGYLSGGGGGEHNGWSLVFNKLVKTKARVDEEDDDVEGALNSLMVTMMAHKDAGEVARVVQCTCKKVQGVEKIMEGFETQLQGLFRQLIQIRVALLNILSHH